MRYTDFYSNFVGGVVKQINIRTAKKLFESGKEIFMQSSNMRFENVWQQPFNFIKDQSNGESFETICNSYKYYNCDNYRGKYIHFFARVEDVK